MKSFIGWLFRCRHVERTYWYPEDNGTWSRTCCHCGEHEVTSIEPKDVRG